MTATETQNFNKTVREIAIENPASVRVFETLGIDYCCSGRKSLREACANAGVPLERAAELLGKAAASGAPQDIDWHQEPLDALAAHIVQKHHGYVRQETPRLEILLSRVVDRHGDTHPELNEIQQLFGTLTQELSMHMMKEEHVLFPYIESMAEAHVRGVAPPPSFFETVEGPISVMLADHDDAGAALAQLRRLSNDYTLPAGACPTFGALYHGLQDFERDLHQHIHLENNILFPRAIEMERGQG